MGQSLGSDEKKGKEIEPIIEKCYNEYFGNIEDWSTGDFYHAICRTVEEINKTIGSTQFRVPKTDTLEQAYQKHHQGKGKQLTKEEFQKILREVIWDTGVTGIGAKDILFYLFGVPATALLMKQRFAPKLIPNEAFIPVVTSATVFLLAKLNKI
ncbi:hypothetical protein CDL12_29016 [Handroanthus impetiginosus]|uniref:Uncharacterized protein n=1 Tax=Handroanthus impetiginosus TaxID=429701 RepID=A0A2G9G033_9LAMI|nr:hypothetical protein CDL12_29016 [Handroanthus impetiginosus]